MLEYDKINTAEGIDVKKIKESRRCIICNYYCYLEVNFIVQLKLCSSCHNIMQKI